MLSNSQRLTGYHPGATRSRMQTSETCSRFLSSHPMPNNSQSTNLALEPRNRQFHRLSQQLPRQSRRRLSTPAQIRQQRGGGSTLEALLPPSHNHIRQSSLKCSQAPQPGDHNDSRDRPPTMILTTSRMLWAQRTSPKSSPNLHPQVVPQPDAHWAADLQLHSQQRAVFQHTPHPSR